MFHEYSQRDYTSPEELERRFERRSTIPLPGMEGKYVAKGYQGLCDGGEYIKEANWADVSGIMQLGGTFIGSARSKDFRTLECRMKAAENLVKHGINGLVVIGGDGSLTGANQFRLEWSSIMERLHNDGGITLSEQAACERLNIVGIVGSIDNDFFGTDMTIGADSALHRVIEATDAIRTSVITRPRQKWSRYKCAEVQKLMMERLGLDNRVTVLGHVQRGGSHSAFERVLGIRMGAEAVLALMDADRDPDLPACVITLSGNQAVRLPLMRCVEKTWGVGETIQQKDFEKTVYLRGRSFLANVESYLSLSRTTVPEVGDRPSVRAKLRVCIVNVGAPACGINAAMRSFVHLAITKGCRVLGIMEVFHGLVNGKVRDIRWNDVTGCVGPGGSMLGARRDTPYQMGIEAVAARLGEYQINGLLVNGGFKAFECMLELDEGRKQFKELCIPMVMIPATISNKVPGTDFSLGADTALNEITTAFDKIKQSAMGTKRRVFVVETMGAYCGYVATMGAVAGGADAAYIHEESFGIDDLREDVTHLRAKMASNVQRDLVLRAERANPNYTTELIHQLYAEEGQSIFDCQCNVLGHVQQGGFGALAIEWLDSQINEGLTGDGQVVTTEDSSCYLLGIIKRSHEFSKVSDL
ncbi:unnamed protein product [Schistocephalus solidus]|uniref:6-phosphofructokinase n=1 Tax=Schistocephalus solidus TaxID=70667 RepID=A0A183SRI8_SCHSO|nr:unnamed protein product [Schistocephalus solidus]